MSFAAIDTNFLIMINSYASYNKRAFWNKLPNLWVRWIAQVQVFRSTTFFHSPPINTSFITPVPLLVPRYSEIVSFLFKNPVGTVIIWHILDLRRRFYKMLKWAIKALKCIILKISYIYILAKFSYTGLTNICTASWALLVSLLACFWAANYFFLSLSIYIKYSTYICFFLISFCIFFLPSCSFFFDSISLIH